MGGSLGTRLDIVCDGGLGTRLDIVCDGGLGTRLDIVWDRLSKFCQHYFI